MINNSRKYFGIGKTPNLETPTNNGLNENAKGQIDQGFKRQIELNRRAERNARTRAQGVMYDMGSPPSKNEKNIAKAIESDRQYNARSNAWEANALYRRSRKEANALNRRTKLEGGSNRHHLNHSKRTKHHKSKRSHKKQRTTRCR